MGWCLAILTNATAHTVGGATDAETTGAAKGRVADLVLGAERARSKQRHATPLSAVLTRAVGVLGASTLLSNAVGQAFIAIGAGLSVGLFRVTLPRLAVLVDLAIASIPALDASACIAHQAWRAVNRFTEARHRAIEQAKGAVVRGALVIGSACLGLEVTAGSSASRAIREHSLTSRAAQGALAGSALCIGNAVGTVAIQRALIALVAEPIAKARAGRAVGHCAGTIHRQASIANSSIATKRADAGVAC